MLTPVDLPLDLMLRGYTQDEVLALTGEDIGYHGSALRTQARGIDRFAYKVTHAQERCSDAERRAAVEAYGAGAPKGEVLRALGLAGENTVKLKQLFAALDLTAEFAAADKRARKSAMRAGMVAKYGVDNPFKTTEFQTKAEDTREAKYGAKYTLAAGSTLADGARDRINEQLADPEAREGVLAKRRATNRDRFGVDYASQSEVIQGRMRVTCQERYGVDHTSQTPERREAQRQYMSAHGKEMAARARVTNQERYGVDSVQQLDEYRARQSERMRDPEHQRQIAAARKRNGTEHTSKRELDLGDLLEAYFGADDLMRQHRDDARYPYACDFYVPSRDLFIEFNGVWTHGGHWFDAGNGDDLATLQQWSRKGGEFHENARAQWTQRDVEKRRVAHQNRLNYVVFWDAKNLSDVRLWLAMGAPDAMDWSEEYSWLPEREVVAEFPYPAKLDARPRTAITVARAANGRTHRARECDLWEANETHPRKWGRLRARLFANRFKYLGKLPHELSDFEILRGLSISGELRAYTTFDNQGLTRVLTDSGARSVYDPCAGWGERLATCAALGIDYLGVDISDDVVAGHRGMVEEYALTRQRTVCADSSAFDARGLTHDLVFTCPPYGGIEVYTEQGAENLSEEGFLAWWGEVVRMSTSPSTEVFAYQINQRWKLSMNAVIESQGWQLVDTIAIAAGGASHFNRSGGVSRKTEFEEVQVFRRK